MAKGTTTKLFEEDKKRLAMLDKKYAKLLKNKSLKELSEDKMPNSEKPMVEQEYQEKAVSFVKPLFELYIKVFAVK